MMDGDSQPRRGWAGLKRGTTWGEDPSPNPPPTPLALYLFSTFELKVLITIIVTMAIRIPLALYRHRECGGGKLTLITQVLVGLPSCDQHLVN